MEVIVMSAGPLAKWGITLPKVPDKAMCEDLLEDLLIEIHTVGMQRRKFEPSPELSLRYETVITWLRERRWLSRRERREAIEEASITHFIGQRCWEALGEPSSEEWHARLKGRRLQS
jgi:hypothetical protein